MTARKTLFLIDGSALFFRAYYAMIRNPLTNHKGENVSALYGFANSLLKIWKDENPDCLAVVFDCKEATFRHELYHDYKGNRDEMPEELAPQLPWIHNFLDVMGVTRLALPGFEADDIMGTLARRGAANGFDVTLVTSDKDFLQLHAPHIQLLNLSSLSQPGKPRFMDEAYALEKFGVATRFMVDLLALMGDASDNVPGVPGIGAKTAAKLIQEFGGLQDIYDSLDKVKPATVQKKLKDGREKAFLSRDLVTIQTDMDLNVNPCDFRSPGRLPEAMGEWLERHEFTSLKKFLKVAQDRKSPEVAPQVAKDTGDKAPLAVVLMDLEAWLERSRETRGKDYGVFLCRGAGGGSAVALSDGSQSCVVELEDLAAAPQRRTLLEKFLEENLERLSGFEVKSLLKNFWKAGISLKGSFFDCGLAAFLLKPERRNPPLSELIAATLPGVPPEYGEFNEGDLLESGPERGAGAGMACALLKQPLSLALEREGMGDTLHRYEIPLIRVLARMETVGILLDVPYLETMDRDIHKELKELVRTIRDLAGEDFNVNSTQQLGRILFETLKIQKEFEGQKVKKTKTGYSTSSESLGRYESLPIVGHLLRYRMLSKIQSTYLQPLTQMVDQKSGRLYALFHQTVTVTGRLSSSNPNLQNIPIRTSEGAAIRRGFIAPEGCVLLSADYSQIELRILAHLSQDPVMLEAFQKDQDIHMQTAAKVFGVPPGEVTSAQRSRAKAVNFGVIYGMGPFRLSRDTGLSIAEASRFIEEYFIIYKGVRRFIDTTILDSGAKGSVKTLFGRVRPLPNLNSTRPGEVVAAKNMAVNTPIQGTAADLIKAAMIAIEDALEASYPKARLLLQVHDELLLEVPSREVEPVRNLVKSLMETVVTLSVPLKTVTGTGANWLEAH